MNDIIIIVVLYVFCSILCHGVGTQRIQLTTEAIREAVLHTLLQQCLYQQQEIRHSALSGLRERKLSLSV